jgi:hypothetical protein
VRQLKETSASPRIALAVIPATVSVDLISKGFRVSGKWLCLFFGFEIFTKHL